MEAGDQLQRAIVDRALIYVAMLWIIGAICAGLWASEMKKRRFWTWVLLSLVSGPIAWYLLLFRVGVYIAPENRVDCPRCGRVTDRTRTRCLHCKALLDPESKNRATNIGRQAAVAVFTAKRLLGGARKVADDAAKRRPGGRG